MASNQKKLAVTASLSFIFGVFSCIGLLIPQVFHALEIFSVITLFLASLSIPAIICGHFAKSKIKSNPDTFKGGGKALAGLIMGYFMLSSTLGAYIYLDVTEKQEWLLKQQLLQEQLILSDIKPDKISKIEIKKENNVFVLEKTGKEEWKMLKPLQLRVETEVVTDFLSRFYFLRKVGSIKESDVGRINYKDYGLDKPRIVIILRKNKASTLENLENAADTVSKYVINIGDKISAGQNNIYINIQGEKDVSVINGTLLEKINKIMILGEIETNN